MSQLYNSQPCRANQTVIHERQRVEGAVNQGRVNNDDGGGGKNVGVPSQTQLSGQDAKEAALSCLQTTQSTASNVSEFLSI